MKLARVFCGPRESQQPYGWRTFCPACQHIHVFVVKSPGVSPSADRWKFDGNEGRPTFSPSMLIYVNRSEREAHYWLLKRNGIKRKDQYGTEEQAREAAQLLTDGGDLGWIPVEREVRSSKGRITLCDYHLQKGMLNYCADSPHTLAGKSVPLPDLPERYLPEHFDYGGKGR